MVVEIYGLKLCTRWMKITPSNRAQATDVAHDNLVKDERMPKPELWLGTRHASWERERKRERERESEN